MAQFTDRLFKRVQPIWDSYLDHPFVKGIGNGDLDQEKFKHWLKQDYIYLIEYARLFSIGAAKSTDLNMMTMFGNLVHGTLHTEMNLHRNYAAQFGITHDELEKTQPSSTTTAYTSYMLNLAQRGGIEHVIAAVLTCTWSYHYIGEALNQIEGARDHSFYGEWIQMYSSEEFATFKEDVMEIMNRVAEGKSESQLNELEEIVVYTSYYEYMFWDMAENLETWSVPVQ
ncbi:thiaminase II [Staphylococcus felis]|uniref:thiaminase II n=1 Tax=Staphylococcus felis TaxID=46127 RepID=UPI000E23CC4B|nr:thiaminase II [Staphylococcus felis]REH80412.1 thiaminase II [Staphylococcus felis]REI00097.1 thiaminase II [Staphylococcus felis]REI08529.1 thiaminase II [Staphylococcus felis]REI14519.1 thiaminase II [Staphylococcus felis]REI25414.1 thiaminase II [Staphylococcus felis]